MVPEAVQMEEQVVRTGVAPAVNIGYAEAGTVLSREFLATVPPTRYYEQAADVAPTACATRTASASPARPRPRTTT